jgi:hypothetical protein
MADHLTISTESDLASSALPTSAVTRRSLLGGAGIAVGAAVLASPPCIPGVAPAAAHPASTDPRPLDEALKRRAFGMTRQSVQPRRSMLWALTYLCM